MVHLMENGYGTEKSIPQMILAGASCDDIYVIVLFSAFVGMAQGGHVNALDFANIPVSILTGVLFGALVGCLLGQLFELLYRKGSYVRNSMKVIIIMGISFLLMALETMLKGMVAFSGLLAVVSMACALKMRTPKEVTGRLSAKFGKLWLAAEVVLFVLVGAAVDIRYTMEAGLAAVGMILLALVFRSVGVALCLLGTELGKKERLFCMIAYLPKATVQAAIGSVPLSMGLSCGKIVLSVAVLAILITAPLGALGMDATYRKLLQKNGENVRRDGAGRQNLFPESALAKRTFRRRRREARDFQEAGKPAYRNFSHDGHGKSRENGRVERVHEADCGGSDSRLMRRDSSGSPDLLRAEKSA